MNEETKTPKPLAAILVEMRGEAGEGQMKKIPKTAMLRGYGGARVDGYVGHVPAGHFDPAARKMAEVTPALKDEMLRKAAERRAR